MKIHKTCNFRRRNTVELSTHFVDSFLSDCPPVYPLVFIWSYRKAQDGAALSSEDIMREFRLTGSDVEQAWRHWEQKGLVTISGDDVTFVDMGELRPPEDGPEKKYASQARTRPMYSVEEIACYRAGSADVARIFGRAEKALGKMLTYNDMSVIFGFHDWLRLPIDVIEFLLTYCDENEHRNLRYIEKCALDWADNGIVSLEAAMFYVKSFDRNYRSIMRYMGLFSYPSASHRDIMDRWLSDWKFPLELIFKCCDITVENTGAANFKYMNKVLGDWHKKGLKTVAEVERAAAEHSAEEKSKREGKPAAPKLNRFINFKQSEYDWAAIEKMERAHLERKYPIDPPAQLKAANDA